MKRSGFFIFIFTVFISMAIRAQSLQPDSSGVVRLVPELSVEVKENDRKIITEIFSSKNRQWKNDSTLLIKKPADFLNTCRENGFLLASIDYSDSTFTFYAGPEFQWISFQPADDLTRRWLQSANLRDKIKPGKPVRVSVPARLESQILENAENSGYPFARVWLDSFSVDTTGATAARLRILPGPFFIYKSLKINGDIKVPEKMVARYLGIKSGDPFNRAQVLKINKQLKSLPYLEQYNNPTVRFAGGTADVNLYLKKKRAGRFDFIIGLLPQTNSDGSTGNLILTGSLNAAFLNALGQGERLSVEIERLRVETQKLDLQAAIPYIAGSPFGAEGRLNIFRRDSTWVDAQGSLGLQYLLSGTDRLVIFGENRSSSLQKADTLAVLATRQLPANLDYRQNGLGIETEWMRLDYRFNPRSGWYLQAKGFAGFHRILRNSQITGLRLTESPDFDFGSLYDSIPEKTVRIRPEIKVEGFIPVFRRSTVLLRGRAAQVYSQEDIYRNEQFRLGGNKLLRGFDEESLFATKWAVMTAEYRLLIGPNSFMSVFADWGYIENITASTRVFQRPLGLGAGMNFETQAGIFGISAAVGRLNPGDGLDVRATKFHLGYVSVF